MGTRQMTERSFTPEQRDSSNDKGKPDAWKLYCAAFRELWPDAEFVSEIASPAALQVMVDKLIAARSERAECSWNRVGGVYETSCGGDLAYEDTLQDCGVVYCQRCGGKVKDITNDE